MADEYTVSVRTIRYDIKAINKYLFSHGLPPLCLNKNGQITQDCSLTGTTEIRTLRRVISPLRAVALNYRNIWVDRSSTGFCRLFLPSPALYPLF